MIVFAQENYDRVVDEMKALLEGHARAMASEGGPAYAPNFPVYKQADSAGILRVYTLREHEFLYGYQVWFVGTNLHDTTSKSATSDVCWIEPEKRRLGVGMRLVRYAETQLKAEGVIEFQQMTKDSHPAMGRLLAATGYARVGSLYSKRLSHA